MAKKKGKKKFTIAELLFGSIILIAVLGIIGVIDLSALGIGAFLPEERLPQTINVDNHNLIISSRSYLPIESVSGSLLIPWGRRATREQLTNGWDFYDQFYGLYVDEHKIQQFDALGYNELEPPFGTWDFSNNTFEICNQGDIGCYPNRHARIEIGGAFPEEVKQQGGYYELRLNAEANKWTCGSRGAAATCTDELCRPFDCHNDDWFRENLEPFFLVGTEFNMQYENNYFGNGIGRGGVQSTGEHLLASNTILLATIYVEPLDCTSTSFVTFQQVFREGTTIRIIPEDPNEVGFAVEDPVLCHTSPILKMDADSNVVFEQSNLEYDLLRDGGAVSVPTGQLWLMFYRGEPLIDDVLQCAEEGGVWNAEENRCELPPTLWFICNGILTQERDCVVQTTDYRCKDPEAVLELGENNEAICVLYGKDTCPAGSNFEIVEGIPRCTYAPDVFCPDGTHAEGLTCIVDSSVFEGRLPDVGFAGLNIMLILIVIIVGGGLAWFFFLRKK